jgi:hypothetical protein
MEDREVTITRFLNWMNHEYCEITTLHGVGGYDAYENKIRETTQM